MRPLRLNGFAKVIVACLALAACDTAELAPDNPPKTDVVDAFAKRFLDTIQAESIAASREFCGYFVISEGALAATRPRSGTEASCDYGPIPANTVASYHTHGSYGEQYDNEVPSGFDLLSASKFGLNDYVSTPGGRLWRVQGGTGNATLLCGLGCLTSDPAFVPRNEGDVAKTYTIQTIIARQEGEPLR